MDGTNDGRGLRCPMCGARELAFSYSKDVAGGLDRVKRCNRCRTRVQTGEIIKRVLPPTAADILHSPGRTTFGQDGITAEF